MSKKLQLSWGTGVLALSMALGAGQAMAFDPLPNLVNLDFSQTAHPPKGSFTDVNPVGWVGGGGLIFINSTSDFSQSAAGPVYLTTYGNPSGAVTGNYVEADGNPDYEGSFSYEVTGLEIGKTYTLSFYQGASQQTTFGNGLPTTNQWIVSLGTVGSQRRSQRRPGGPCLWSDQPVLQHRPEREHCRIPSDDGSFGGRRRLELRIRQFDSGF